MSWEHTSDHGVTPNTDRTGLCIGSRRGRDCDHQATRPHLCEECRQTLRSQLRELPLFATQALAHRGKSTSTGGERVDGTREPVLPGQTWLDLMGPAAGGQVSLTPGDREAVGDAGSIVSVPALLDQWVRLIGEERDIEIPDLLTDALANLARLVDWLDRHADWASSQTWADEFAGEVAESYGRLRSAAGLRPDITRVPGICPVCDRRDHLIRYGPRTEPRYTGQLDSNGDEIVEAAEATIVCQPDPETGEAGCGNSITESQYEEWTKYVLADDGERAARRKRRNKEQAA